MILYYLELQLWPQYLLRRPPLSLSRSCGTLSQYTIQTINHNKTEHKQTQHFHMHIPSFTTNLDGLGVEHPDVLSLGLSITLGTFSSLTLQPLFYTAAKAGQNNNLHTHEQLKCQVKTRSSPWLYLKLAEIDHFSIRINVIPSVIFFRNTSDFQSISPSLLLNIDLEVECKLNTYWVLYVITIILPLLERVKFHACMYI